MKFILLNNFLLFLCTLSINILSHQPNINKDEVEAYKWMSLEDVKCDIEQNPSIYTEWFKIIFKESYEKLTNA